MIKKNLEDIIKTLKDGVTLVAVSKTKPNELIQEAYDAGQREFGENKVQEMVAKHEALPKDIKWHMIGHLQTNKVKYIASFAHLIHSVDSLKLLKEINKQANKSNRVQGVLLQFHIAKEETKFGLSLEEAEDLLNSEVYKAMKNIEIRGVMGMATFTENETQIREEFDHLHSIFDQLHSKYFKNTPTFKEISMGMSSDYQIAMEVGSTMIRVGSSIFGQRNYL